MRNLTELTPAESSNMTSQKANFTPGELAEIQQMQSRIYYEEDYQPLENWNDDEY